MPVLRPIRVSGFVLPRNFIWLLILSARVVRGSLKASARYAPRNQSAYFSCLSCVCGSRKVLHHQAYRYTSFVAFWPSSARDHGLCAKVKQ
ncbi:hypothetical protein BJY01DRAFT_229786 [Aspergillus pseudoustus]|uniref:Secreted protein n=1 Tax=Aspergillus pseudoustus TaxID=1810923 RepID=A0ABR4IGJ6_9EURO